MNNENSLKILASFLSNMYELEIDEVDNKLNSNISEKEFFQLFNIPKKDEKIIANIKEIIFNETKEKEDFNYEKIKNVIKREREKKDKYIFEKMTYPLYLFTKKLYFTLVKNGAQKVYFFAREGEFLQKLFDTFQNFIVGPKIKTEYLYVSRASTFLGTLKDIKQEEFFNLFHQYPNMSLKVFLENIAFNQSEINNLSKILKIDFTEEIINIKNSKEFKKLIKNQEFIKLYDEKRSKAKNNFIEYLQSFGDDYKNEMHVVDVGWKGSIQSNMQKIIPHTKIVGYYLGLVNYEEFDLYEKKKAILFENTPYYKTNNCYLYNSNRSIFEMLLGASHGSTIGYKKERGKVEPILNSQEKELKMYEEKIKPIQNNIYNKFMELLKILNVYFDNDIEKIFNKKYFELIFNPSIKEVDEYNSFYHFENFGIMVYSTFDHKIKLSFKEKIQKYCHFKSFIRYDDTWQYLKLHNYGMNFGKIILYWYKWFVFKKQKLI